MILLRIVIVIFIVCNVLSFRSFVLTVGQTKLESRTLVAISDYLAKEAAKADLNVSDLHALEEALYLMQEKAKARPPMEKDVLANYSDNVFTIFDNVLHDQHEETWKQLPKRERAQMANNFNEMVEETGFMIASSFNNATTEMIEKHSFCVMIASDDDNCDEPGHFSVANWTDEHNYTWSANMTLPNSWGVGCHPHDRRTMVGLMHTHLHRYLQNSHDKLSTKVVKSIVIGVNVHNATFNAKFEEGEEVFISLNLLNKVMEDDQQLECGFWKFNKATYEGYWDNEGCRMVWKDLHHVVCACSHLTNFAVLMDMNGQIPDDNVIKYISVVCGSLSILCEIVTFIVLHSFRSLKTTRTSITKNLCVCLAIGTTIMMFGLEKTEDKVACSVVAGFIQYFFLCAFAWMAMEGYHLYLLLVKVFQSKETHAGRRYLIAYGVPLIVVGISAGVCHESYGTERYCWLDAKKHCVWFFLGPVAFVILVNLIFLIVSLRSAASVQKLGRDVKKTEKFKKWMRGAFSLTTLLGITWIVGYLDFGSNIAAFRYIFCFLSASQGMFIFFFHCLRNENVRLAIRRAIARTAQNRFYSSSRRPTNATMLDSNSSSRRCRSRTSSQDSSTLSHSTTQIQVRPMPSSVMKGINLSLKHLPSQYDVLWKEHK